MIEIKQYSNNDKFIWNNFLEYSKIDSFLFNRDFMDYHSNRFVDCSYIIFRKSKVEAIFPGNIKDSIFYSHQGLTYGGLIPSSKLTVIETLQIFDLINSSLKSKNIKEIIYKPTPSIYHIQPSEEDLYALFRLNAVKIGCNISSTIFQSNKIQFIELRKRGIRKALKEDIKIIESTNIEPFWRILEDNLHNTYGTRPVHSVIEISLLKKKFPNQIKLYLATLNDETIGGCILFIMKKVIHVQYISANEIGKKLGALDLLFDTLINNVYTNFPVFDFGQSTENMGSLLNERLIFQKEGFGGRGIVYEIYKYKI